MGFLRETFYRYKHAVEEGGVEALMEKKRRKPNLKNRVDMETENTVLEFAIDYPAYGQLSILHMLTDRGTEFCGKAEQHDYELYLAINDISIPSFRWLLDKNVFFNIMEPYSYFENEI